MNIVTLDESLMRRWILERKGKRGISFLRHEDCLAQYLARVIDIQTEVLNPNDTWGTHVAYHFKKHHQNSVSVLMLSDLDTARWSLFDSALFGRKKNMLKWPLHYLKDLYERWYMASQDCIVVLNTRTVGLVKKYLGRKATVVRSGIDTALFPFTTHQLPVKGKPVRLLSHGIFYMHRRYEDTLRAVKLLRDVGHNVTLDIVGDFSVRQVSSDYYQKILTMIDTLRLTEYVTMHGRVSDAKLGQLYSECHVFVSAAHMQTWGLAVFEALASGLPVALSETIGAAEVLENGKTAMFFLPGNPESQAKAIEVLMTDSDKYQAISVSGSDFVRGTLSREKYGEAMLEIFKQAVNAR